MKVTRRGWLGSLLLAAAGLLAACSAMAPAVDPSARQVLAPTATLRVGVYMGSPTSLVKTRSGDRAGVAHDLGHDLARHLGVPVQVVEFARLALVLEALKAGQVDLTFTNATESRARDVDFTPPLVKLELGYLAPRGSAITSVDQVDRAGVRVGVSEGSTSQGVLTRQFKQAKVVPAASLKVALQMLQQGQIDVFATNKGILFEMADELAGSQVVQGRWGFENLAIAIPKGRSAGMPVVEAFARQVQADGRLQTMLTRAGLRGTARD